MDNNGWPGEPGVPLNPERDGWHWVKPKTSPKGGIQLFDESAPRPMPWNIVSPLSHEPAWNGVMEPKHADNAWQYIGPCFTPAEVVARVAQARRDALEEAALAAENEPEPEGDPPPELHGRSVKNIATASVRATKRNIAAAIRALGEKE
jgi:hypothetical protein